MSNNVNSAEADAIKALLGSSPDEEVRERDFGQPRRFSSSNLKEVRSNLQKGMAEISHSLKQTLGKEYGLAVSAIGEVSAQTALASLEDPLAALRVDVGGQPGWIVWSSAAATRAVEMSLGATEVSEEERSLTQLECAIAEGILVTVTQGLLHHLGLQFGGASFAQTPQGLGDWRTGNPNSSPYRLSLQLTFDGPGGASEIQAYLPVERNDPMVSGGRQHLDLPDHLGDVTLDVGARLGASLVELDQLLSLEVGDVIPLDVEIGDPAQIMVQGRTFAHGTLGTCRGRIAIRIDQFEHQRAETPNE